MNWFAKLFSHSKPPKPPKPPQLMTDEELAEKIRKEDKCPFCGQGLYSGPKGGLCVNYLCHNDICCFRINVTIMPEGFPIDIEITDRGKLANKEKQLI
ncbi:hypothetical protein LCGC14_0146410 [marine sediment metagenome]|uniref:Uncharacterized protein n=1 Tax=marine sediment metagenome TaxID=412755 RepID=A0A0F9UZY6_9ZZZZ